MKKTICWGAILLICALLLCACAAPAPEAEPSPALPAQEPTPEATAQEPTPVLPEPASWQEVDPAQPIRADLDEDGEEETITIEVDEEAYTTLVSVEDGGKTYSEKLDSAYMYPRCYIGDAITGDGVTELFLTGDTASADYYTEIFRLRDGKLQHAELYGTVQGVDGSGILPVESVIDVLGTYGASCTYRLQPDLTLERSSDYTVLYTDDKTERAITLKRDGLPAVEMQEGAEPKDIKLDAGTRLILVATDGKSYADLERADAAQPLVRLQMSRDQDVDWQWYIDGIAEQEWFEMLLYAG